MTDTIRAILPEIRSCTVCAKHLPQAPRPVVQFGASAKIIIIGQAPGSKVHASGVPWQDQSGERLRDWTGLAEQTFYDPASVALMPMGFCYPGAKDGADLAPRPECAPLWHARILALLPKLSLTILVGIHAQSYYLRGAAKPTMTETVREFAAYGPKLMPLPHPSWRSTGWMRRNAWFEADVLPALRKRVRAALAG
jgi:uracil-DNA glycosylase